MLCLSITFFYISKYNSIYTTLVNSLQLCHCLWLWWGFGSFV